MVLHLIYGSCDVSVVGVSMHPVSRGVGEECHCCAMRLALCLSSQLGGKRQAGGAEQFLAHGPHFNRFQRGGADISASPRASLQGELLCSPIAQGGAAAGSANRPTLKRGF